MEAFLTAVEVIHELRVAPVRSRPRLSLEYVDQHLVTKVEGVLELEACSIGRASQ